MQKFPKMEMEDNMDEIVFKVPMNEIGIHPQYLRLRAKGIFDVKIPTRNIASVRKNFMGQVEIETSGGKSYKVSLGKFAKLAVAEIDKILYGG